MDYSLFWAVTGLGLESEHRWAVVSQCLWKNGLAALGYTPCYSSCTALGQGKSISWQNFSCPQCNITKTRSSFPVAFSPHFLHHFNRTKKFYKWKTHAIPLEHFKSKKIAVEQRCCPIEETLVWNPSQMSSDSWTHFLVSGKKQFKGTIHPSCFQAYFRISLITPQQSPLLGRSCEGMLGSWYSHPYACLTLVENTPTAFHVVSSSISLGLNHSYLNPGGCGSFQKI